MRKLLARYGIVEPILAQWEKRFGGRLLPLQYRAIEDYHLLDGTSLLISAPTSSGKTFCGEMALIRAVQNRQKAIFLVPLKAIAEEKYRRFAESYAELGLRVAIATRDHPESDPRMERGDFDIAVMVYEKFNALLLKNFDILAQVGTVVVDELQMLEDRTRGPHLELALTKLLCSNYHPQIIALSAVVGDALDLAEWLGCRLLLEKMRPVELRRGVVVGGTFHYRCHNSGDGGEEQFKQGEDAVQTLFENIRDMHVAGRQVLVFLKSRHETMLAAERFVQFAHLMPIAENQAYFDPRLADEEESSLLDGLRHLLSLGISFHNADLTASQRLLVEEGYRAGLVRVIFATTTLSTGINLPAGTVFIEAQKYRQQEHTRRPELEPLSWAEYESMSGRAGRVGLIKGDDGCGRAVLLASSELEKTILWDYYVTKRPMRLQSQLMHLSMADIVVDLFSSELVTCPYDVDRVLARAYYARSNAISGNVKEELFNALLDGGFLERQGDFWAATPLGKAIAAAGISIAGAQYILREADLAESDSDTQILYRMLHSPEGRDIYLPSPRQMRRWKVPGLLSTETADSDPLIAELISLRRELSPTESSRLKLTLLMSDWMIGMSGLDIENKYRLHPGMMESLAHQVGWLLASTASIIRASDRFSGLLGRLDRLAFSVRAGLPEDSKELYDIFGRLLFRREIMQLREHDMKTARQLSGSGRTVLRTIVSSDERLDRIEKHLKKIEEDDMHTMTIDRNEIKVSATWPNSIEIDGTPVRERFLVRINNCPVSLTGKSFKYLLKLVWSRLTKDSGWLYKEDLEHGFNQARYLYRLRQEVGRDLFPDWPLYENNRSGYYRLAADRDGLRVNLSALKEFPDYEVQQIAVELAPLVGNG